MSERHDQDPAAQVAAELRARLRAMSGEELVELCAQLLTTYVIEGVVPLSRASESTELAEGAGEESFAQLLRRLQAAKKDPVLERFIVDGENISVRIDGQGVLPLTQYRRPSGSIYNRALQQDQERPAPRQAPAPQPAAPAQAQAPQRPAQPPQPEKKKEEPKNDRFSLIELE